MKGHKTEHPRKRRGKEFLDEETKQPNKNKSEDKTKPEELEERIESKFIVPDLENFVVTEEVESYANRALTWIQSGFPVHVVGPTGCGKTALALHLAEEIGNGTLWINGDEEVSTKNLVGGYSGLEKEVVRDKYIHSVYKDKKTIDPKWVSNPLTLAAKRGHTLIYNEFSRSPPEANNVLLSVLEEGVLELPTKFGKERYIDVHPDFNVLLTSNSIEYAGVHRPQDALLDRIATLYMDYYGKEAEKKILSNHCSSLSQEWVERIVSSVRKLRNEFDPEEKPGTRALMMLGGAVGNSKEPNELFEQFCLDVIASKTPKRSSLDKKKKVVRKIVGEVIESED